MKVNTKKTLQLLLDQYHGCKANVSLHMYEGEAVICGINLDLSSILKFSPGDLYST